MTTIFKSLEDFKLKLQAISKLEFCKSLRKGDTGIGYTLESLLQIKENNVPLADLGDIELKTCRKDSDSMLTLFTCEPKPRGGARDKLLLTEFGYKRDRDGRELELYCTLNATNFNNQTLKLGVESNMVRILSSTKSIDIFWDFEKLAKHFKKIKRLIIVEAEVMFQDDVECFYFSNAYLLEGIQFQSFCKLVQESAVTVDLRMHLKSSGRVRNHGTAFRVHKRRLPECYETRTKLL